MLAPPRCFVAIRQQLILYACLAGFVIWWVHAILNHLFPPNATLLDVGLFILASICKLTVLVALPFFMRRLCRELDHNQPVLKRCVLDWSLSLALLLSLLGWFHDDLAVLLSNEAVRFYYVSDSSPLSEFHYLGREEWLLRWKSGAILLAELTLGLVAIGLISVVGYWLGKKKATFLLLSVGLAVLVTGWPLVFGLLVPEYDIFLGGIFSDCLALDLLWPFTAMDPSSEVTFTVLLFFVAASSFALRGPMFSTSE